MNLDYSEIELVDAKRLMEIFCIGLTTLRQWRNEGVPCVHIGKSAAKGARGIRFNPRAVHAWLVSKGATPGTTAAAPATEPAAAEASECP